MQQVDFYVLADTTREARWLFTCKLIEKVMRLNFQVHVLLDNNEECHAFSHLLWSFKPESFLPHLILDGEHDRPTHCPITLGTEAGAPTVEALHLAPEMPLVLVNLSQSSITAPIHALMNAANRIAEVVVKQEHCLAITRNRYKAYQQLGIPVETRKIETAQ